MAIAETMYDHYSGDYEISHLKDVNVKYHTMNDDMDDIYSQVREALISRLCRPHGSVYFWTFILNIFWVYAAPWKEEELESQSWFNDADADTKAGIPWNKFNLSWLM